MARTLSLYKTYLSTTTKLTTSTPRRLQSFCSLPSDDQSFDHIESSSSATTDPTFKALEDVVQQIFVRQIAPDWLPFLPGHSYWVPPRRIDLAKLIDKLANPLTHEESMAITTGRGWPSSDYFIKGGSADPVRWETPSIPPPHPVEGETVSIIVSKPEDKEG